MTDEWTYQIQNSFIKARNKFVLAVLNKPSCFPAIYVLRDITHHSWEVALPQHAMHNANHAWRDSYEAQPMQGQTKVGKQPMQG